MYKQILHYFLRCEIFYNPGISCDTVACSVTAAKYLHYIHCCTQYIHLAYVPLFFLSPAANAGKEGTNNGLFHGTRTVSVTRSQG